MGPRRFAIFATAFMTGLATFAAPALSQQGTSAQREACTPDAFRLCGRYIPDADRVAVCLRDAGPRLSPGCYAVFYPDRANDDRRAPRRRYLAPRRSDDDED